MAGSLDPSGRRSGVFVKESVVPRPATRSIETGPGPLSSEQVNPPAASDATRAIFNQRWAAMAPPLGAGGAAPRNVETWSESPPGGQSVKPRCGSTERRKRIRGAEYRVEQHADKLWRTTP